MSKQDGKAKKNDALGQVIFGGFLLLVILFFLYDSLYQPRRIRLLPQIFLIIMLFCQVGVIIQNLRKTPKDPSLGLFNGKLVKAFFWEGSVLVMVLLIGLKITSIVFPLIYMIYSKEPWKRIVIVIGVINIITWGLFVNILHIPFDNGVIGRMMGIYW